MNTALKELINTLEEQINFGNEDCDKDYKRGLKVAKSLSKSFFQKEKQQIIDAYRAGLGGESFEITCQDEVYFQRTYINPNYGDCSFEP